MSTHLLAGFELLLMKYFRKLVVGVGFEPTNAEAGGFTVRIL